MARPKKVTKTASKKATAKGKAGTIKMLSAKTSTNQSRGTKRPPNNPSVPEATITQLNNDLNDIKTLLDDYSQHLRA